MTPTSLDTVEGSGASKTEGQKARNLEQDESPMKLLRSQQHKSLKMRFALPGLGNSSSLSSITPQSQSLYPQIGGKSGSEVISKWF